MLRQIDINDVIRHDPRAKVLRLLSHQLQQLRAADSVSLMRRHVLANAGIDGRIEIPTQIAKRKSRIVFDLGRLVQLTERQGPLDRVFLVNAPS